MSTSRALTSFFAKARGVHRPGPGRTVSAPRYQRLDIGLSIVVSVSVILLRETSAASGERSSEIGAPSFGRQVLAVRALADQAVVHHLSCRFVWFVLFSSAFVRSPSLPLSGI
ncbi:hypothetical protein NL676_028161 [Syzygium grande]|nr:hypothetical protein NL676_028161 [Syzygium grande]